MAKLGLVGGLGNPAGFPDIRGLLGASQGGKAGNSGWTNGVRDYDDKPTAVISGTLVKGNHTYKFGAEWWKDIWSFIGLQHVRKVHFFGRADRASLPAKYQRRGRQYRIPVRQLSVGGR